MCISLPLAAQPAPAPEQHAVDMTRPILDQNHKTMPDVTVREPDDKDCKNCPVLTVGRIVAMALNANFDDEKAVGWQMRFDRSTLAQRIINNNAAVLDSTETAVIQRLLGKLGLNGLVLLQVVTAIDPNVKAGKVQ